MKFNNLYGWAFVATMMSASFSACSNNAKEDIMQESEINLTSEIIASRVVSQNLQSTSIVPGQSVGVFINGAKEPHNNGKWTANADGTLTNTGNPVYWGASNNVTITAYHPYNADNNGDPYTFSVSTDQSTDAGYLNSDLLWTTTTSTKTNNPVQLTFSHLLSKINVTLTSDHITDLSNATISICNTITSGTFDPMEGTIMPTGNVSEIKASVTTTGAYTASAIILPQHIEEGVKFIKVNHNDKVYYYSLALPGGRDFVNGYSYTYKLKIYADKIKEISSNITDWNDVEIEGDMEEENATNQPSSSYYANGEAYVATGGELSTIISSSEKNSITSLKITGYLNSDDIRFIREMAGGTYDYNWQLGGGQLKNLDISECTIVAGGDPFGKHEWVTDSEEINKYKTSNDRLGQYAFAQTGLEYVSLPTSVMILDDCILSNCPNLQRVSIPDNVTDMCSYIFGGSERLLEITLPKNLRTFTEGTFDRCRNLQSITIDESNPNYYINEDGILYGRDNALYCNPGASTLTDIFIKEGTTIVRSDAFSCCSNLEVVTIPSSVTEIGNDAFYGCSNLSSIKILGTNPPRIDYTVTDISNNQTYYSTSFDYIGNTSFKIYVPADSYDTYIENWKDVKITDESGNTQSITDFIEKIQ